MRRIDTWIQRLNRYRELQRWLAEHRRDANLKTDLSPWLIDDLNLKSPPNRDETKATAKSATQHSLRKRTGLTPVGTARLTIV